MYGGLEVQITTATKQKTQQIRKHNGKSENSKTETLTKPEKVGTLGWHESSLIGLVVRPLSRMDMV